MNFSNFAQTSLLTSYLAGGTTMVFRDASKFPAPPFLYCVDNEVFLAGSVSGNAITCNGAQEGSTAANHTAGAPAIHGPTAATYSALYALLTGRRTVTEAGDVTLSNTDRYVEIDKVTPEATNLILPPDPPPWFECKVKYFTQSADQYPLTILGDVDHLTDYQFNQDDRERTVLWNPDVQAWRFV